MFLHSMKIFFRTRQHSESSWFFARSCSERVMFSLLIWADILNSRYVAQCTSATNNLMKHKGLIAFCQPSNPSIIFPDLCQSERTMKFKYWEAIIKVNKLARLYNAIARNSSFTSKEFNVKKQTEPPSTLESIHQRYYNRLIFILENLNFAQLYSNWNVITWFCRSQS